MRKTALIILDGWGIGNKTASDAIYNAQTPFFDRLCIRNPSAQLLTHGENVGLPEGQMGNSEVGHLNIGAGRIVYQELTRIDRAIREGDFFKNESLLEAMKRVKETGCDLHLMGLVSTGGVHASQEHLYALLEMAVKNGIGHKTFVHGFSDGRDCNPKTGKKHFENLNAVLKKSGAKLSTVIGRYYAMDRDHRWARIKEAYDLMIHGKGEVFDGTDLLFEKSYFSDITDEFIRPSRLLKGNEGLIKDGDVVISFNFRTDRCREICQVLTQKDFPEFEMKRMDIALYTMTEYDSSFEKVHVVYRKDNLENTLGEIIANAGLKQIRIAETEKYPHVSYFFSGGREVEFTGEKRLMIPSPKVATYDLQPAMSAHEIASAILAEINDFQPDFICLNFANTDMVGHTGVYSAIVSAAEEVDAALAKVVTQLEKFNYAAVIIADHGNADNAINSDGTPNTAHSLNPVPIIVISPDVTSLSNGVLADVAPTVLDLMKIKQPSEMTGQSLIKN